VFDRAALAASAELLGLAHAMLDVAVAYAKDRRQFGRPIGSFQAVQHHLVDAVLKIRFATPAVHHAAWSVEHGHPDASVHVSIAKIHASEAASLTARKALQVHGAIGYTFEHHLHLWMKRSWSLARAWGDPGWHLRRVGAHVLGDA
jgi:alkylation response protein AidB-like acyl-CoA dehydrogenase